MRVNPVLGPMAIPAEQQQHRESFGRAVSAWMRMNNFSQQTMHDWAAAAGTEGPWNSQCSLLQRGKLDPKPQFFVAFGKLNQDLANGNLACVTDRKLKDKLVEAMPLLTEHDQPATATAIYSMFIGEMQPAAIYTQPIAISDADAEKLTQQYRDAFRKLAVSEMISTKEVWQKVEPACQQLGMKAAQVKHFQEVLVGLADYTREELMDLSTSANDKPLPGKALDTVS